MSSDPSEPLECKHCGKPLREGDLGNVCHACLMSEALDTQGTEADVDTALPTVSDANPDRQLAPDPLEGTTLGPVGRYKLLQRLGEGGFGTVYMAEQTAPVRRRVAVKVIKAGMDTRQVVARFEAERQALAMMDHPNIAKILDGGETDQGRPFFVMELVRGSPITQYCDREQLDTGTRLGLFLTVCRAVQHAHQKGIIHRDLKPSNILITAPDGAEPVPKVIDFGVAKALESNLTDKTLFTRFEQMIGTPSYMSPEQAGTEGGIDVDTRADIYALGVLLYELLAGTTPFEASTLQQAAFEEVRRILREEEAPRPSARLSSLAADRRSTIAQERGTEEAGLGKLLRGDLDWIVMKAIEKDRRRRYETANALAMDVERHLADEPVSASPPTAAYRTGKFLRRHKAPLAIAATVALLLVAGITATGWQALRATAERNRALEAEALAEERQAEAESISEFITGIFETAKPGVEAGSRTITVEESLKIAENRLKADQEMPADRRAALQGVIASVYQSLGRYEEAKLLREEAFRTLRKILGSGHPDTLLAMHNLAGSIHDAGRPEGASKMWEEVLSLRRKTLGPEHPDTLASMHNLANSYAEAGRREAALATRENVVTIRRKVHGETHPFTLWAMLNLAVSYGEAGRREEAIALSEGAIEMFEEMLELRREVDGDEHPNTLRAWRNLAISYGNAGHRDQAVATQEQVLKLSRKVLGDKHPETLSAMHSLAHLYDNTGRREEALTIREDVLKRRRKILGPEHLGTRRAGYSLADSYVAVGRVDEAIMLNGGSNLLLKASSPRVTAVLVSPSSQWRWLHPIDGTNQPDADPDFLSTFFLSEFDDSGWRVGADNEAPQGGFGYGDEGFVGVDIGSPENLDLGQSAYFRRRFITHQQHSNLELRCHRDDGIIVYLDGQEVARDNMMDGEEISGPRAKSHVVDEAENAVFRIPLNEVVLEPGEHILAISLHNPEEPSSDLRIGAITLVEVAPKKAAVGE